MAANLAAAAVGSETDGSIVSPSSNNSLVGIKPTLGLVSRSGIVPIAHSQDTAGPMARTVEDATLLLAAMAGADPNDAGGLPPKRAPTPLPYPLDANGEIDYDYLITPNAAEFKLASGNANGKVLVAAGPDQRHFTFHNGGILADVNIYIR